MQQTPPSKWATEHHPASSETPEPGWSSRLGTRTRSCWSEAVLRTRMPTRRQQVPQFHIRDTVSELQYCLQEAWRCLQPGKKWFEIIHMIINLTHHSLLVENLVELVSVGSHGWAHLDVCQVLVLQDEKEDDKRVNDLYSRFQSFSADMVTLHWKLVLSLGNDCWCVTCCSYYWNIKTNDNPL